MPDPTVDPTSQPPTIAVDLHTELTATVAVIELGNGAVTLAIGDDVTGIRLIGTSRDIHTLIIEADRPSRGAPAPQARPERDDD